MKKLFSIFMALVQLTLFAVLGGATSMYLTGEVSMLAVFGGVAVGVFASFFALPVAALETIPVDQVRAALTNSMVEFYRERPVVKSFLRSFFPAKTSPTKFISIEVQRGTEKLAVDIQRGTGSNKVQATKSTVKTILPPFYSEEFNVNELEVYDVAYGSLDPGMMRALATEQAEMAGKIIDMIDRSYEKQCADALQTGIITLQNHDSIDFRRKAGSMEDISGEYWNNSSNDPGEAFRAAGKFLREQGKIQGGPGGRYAAILGGKALNDLLNNTIFQNKYDRKNIDVGSIIPAQMSTDGASYHGFISVDSYIFDLWTYPEVYTAANGTITPYIDSNKMIVLPYKPNFSFVYGMVPQLPGIVSPLTLREGFYTLEYVDPKLMNHAQRIMSAGVAVPYAIDQMYTRIVTPA